MAKHATEFVELVASHLLSQAAIYMKENLETTWNARANGLQFNIIDMNQYAFEKLANDNGFTLCLIRGNYFGNGPNDSRVSIYIIE